MISKFFGSDPTSWIRKHISSVTFRSPSLASHPHRLPRQISKLSEIVSWCQNCLTRLPLAHPVTWTILTPRQGVSLRL